MPSPAPVPALVPERDPPPAEAETEGAHPPRLETLRLADFRNHRSAELALGRDFVVFYGPNGSGKTNLLEAVSLLSPGRGLRRATYGDMMRRGGSGGFSVRADIGNGTGSSRILTKVLPASPGARQVEIEGSPARSAEEMADLVRVAWLTPAMDGLFTGPAGDRRRFLDRMVLAIDPTHGRRAADYERAMRARNRLLSEGRGAASGVGGFEAQMAELGIAIAMARAELVGLLGAAASQTAQDAPFPRASLSLETGLQFETLEQPAALLEDAFRERLAEGRGLDARAGRTLEGPHRAELHIVHAEKDMPAALSSTGEQKALLIGLVLAHARLVARVSGLPPVLLLDEVAAHLDAGRRAALFDLIGGLGVQAIMTGTDAHLFEALGERMLGFTVEAGIVRPLSGAGQ